VTEKIVGLRRFRLGQRRRAEDEGEDEPDSDHGNSAYFERMPERDARTLAIIGIEKE
jgi:hypothetical protein